MQLLEGRCLKVISAVLALGLAAGIFFTAIPAVYSSFEPVTAAREAAADDADKLTGKETGELTDEADVDTASPPERASGGEVGWEQTEEIEQQASPQTAPASAGDKADVLSEGDIWLMAQLIHAEGRGEPLEGQVAIGAVLLNRLRDSRFPNSVAGVIYEPGAFCTVRDGQINLTPDAKALRAARLAAAGWDPTGGALYFYNPARSTSAWIYTRPVLTRIGRHVFAG
ncbi:MAG TPA: hypothetical protein GXX47_00780 [Firmicutes bacterium]|nr:hypothetical protein [Bacillota bacterium]